MLDDSDTAGGAAAMYSSVNRTDVSYAYLSQPEMDQTRWGSCRTHSQRYRYRYLTGPD